VSRQIFLMEEDFEAAQELASRGIKLPQMQQGDVARFHAVEGQRRFRLLLGIEPPRHRFEEHELARATGSITDQEYKRRMLDDENSPICIETLSAYFEDRLEQIDWYGRLLQSMSVVPNAEGKFPKAGFVERCLRELKRSLSLPARQLEILVEFLEEQRVSRGMGRIVIKESTYSCSFDLMASTGNFAREAWKKSLEISERSVGKQRISIMATQLFSQEFLPHLPLPGELESILQEEYALGRLALKSSEALFTPVAATVSATNEDHSKAKAETDDDQSDGNGTPTSIAEKATTSRSATTSKHKPNLERWAIAAEDGQQWWLFHLQGRQWHQRAKLKVPPGLVSVILLCLLEERGSATIGEFVRAVCRHRHQSIEGGIPETLFATNRDSATEAIKRCQNLIRNGIAKVLDISARDVGNPIPHSKPSWRVKIQMGYATRDEHNRLSFKPLS